MNAVRYYSKTGNTKKVAEMIANQLDVAAKPVDVPLEYPVHKLFLGGAIHMATIDKELKDFAENLDPTQVREVVMFGTSGGVLSIKKSLKRTLSDHDVHVSKHSLFIHGLIPSKANISEKQVSEISDFVQAENQ